MRRSKYTNKFKYSNLSCKHKKSDTQALLKGKQQRKLSNAPAQHDIYNALIAVSNHRLAQESRTKERPERHQKVSTGDAAEVEGDVRIRGHD